jgi:hypothetical protein
MMGSQVLVRKGVQIGVGCALICLLCFTAQAQYKVSSALFKKDRSLPTEMLSSSVDSLAPDSASGRHGLKSPTTAVLLSALLPGAGQIYTGRYWKVPLILGFGGYFVSEWIKLNNHYAESRDGYAASVAAGMNKGQGDAQLLYERDFYRDERDRFAFYVVLTYLLNIVDAYVGASLYDFDVGDNLGGGTSVKIRIPIH